MYTQLETVPSIGRPAIQRPVAPEPQSLSDAEFGHVQAYIGRTMNELLRMGLMVHIENDFDAFAHFRRSVGDGWCNPSFDPKLCHIGPSDFWLRADDDSGRTVAAIVMRIFEGVDDFYQLMRSGALWCDRLLRVVDRCDVCCTIPDFGGVIGYSGGLWVDPSQRGRGLAKLLPGLQRGLMLRNNPIDFETGLVFEPLVTLALRQYQYARCPLVVDGYFPPTGKSERVYLCHMSRAEALASVGFATRDDGEALSAVA